MNDDYYFKMNRPVISPIRVPLIKHFNKSKYNTDYIYILIFFTQLMLITLFYALFCIHKISL